MTEAAMTLAPAEQLGAEITHLCSYIYAAEARLLSLLRKFDSKRYWEDQGFHSCAHWMNFKCGIGLNAARERIRVAHALAALPKTTERFENGELSYSKVRAITRIADESNEDYLLMIARHGTAHHVEQLISKYRGVLRRRELDTANEQHRDRILDYYFDETGSLIIRGRLPAEQGALVIKALEMAMDQGFHSDDATDDVTAETADPAATRRADALSEVAETYLNNNKYRGSTADRYQVIVHVSDSEPTLADVTAETPHIDNGPGVTAETARRIGCDCSVLGVRQGQEGEPLNIGRRTRAIPPAIRRALQLRDDGCRFPGCTHKRFVDGHHIEHWADGGETCLDNLVLLCRHHHRLVHEGGFRCEKTADGELVFRDKRNAAMPHWSVLPSVARDIDIQAWLDQQFLETDIDSDTCSAQWYAGDRIDWHMAVGGLFL